MSLHQRHWKKVKTGKAVNETAFLLKTYPPSHELWELFFKDHKFNLVLNNHLLEYLYIKRKGDSRKEFQYSEA